MNSKIAQLEAEIRHHQRLYYDLNQPVISDISFDKLWEELKSICPNSPVLQERASYDADVPHIYTMGSLEKCKTVDDIVTTLGAYGTGLISHKLDGASLAVRYKDGRLVKTLTRGRTEVQKGKDVTANALMVQKLPKNIPFAEECEVRGECVIFEDDWLSIAHLFKNPRNAASGGLSCLNPQETKERKITFVGFKIISKKNDVYQDINDFDLLKSYGFITPHQVEVDLSDKGAVQRAISQMALLKTELPYWTDGLVIRVKDNNIYNSLGFSGVCPKGACAYKFDNEKAKTTITDIIWEVGRLGFVTPVAIFDPVEIGGATITKCTLHNPLWMKANGNPSIGSVVWIEKCGDIIPGVASVENEGTEYSNIPKTCPSCNYPLEINETITGKGAKLVCLNSNSCPAQFHGTVLNMLKVLDIKGISDSTIAKMVEAKLLQHPWDIFSLSINDLISVGFGDKQSFNIKMALQAVEVKASVLLASMGIEMWGRRMFAKLQSENSLYDDERLLSGEFDFDEVANTAGIGEVRAGVLCDYFAKESARQFLEELKKHVSITKPVVAESSNSSGLLGKTFVITGTLSKPRKEIETWISSNGGVVSSGVSKNLDYLVCGEKAGSKKDKAEKLNIQCITEEELVLMV